MEETAARTSNWNRDAADIRAFRDGINMWGQKNSRSFPWRKTDDSYLILMAEVMLHRTQVVQVVPVYAKFVDRYPDLIHLVGADREELKFILKPLGLQWRINLIYAMVQVLRDRFGLLIPKEKTDLLSLPGVSDYIASAVRCFAWNLPEPLVDTNTVRIIGRVSGWPIKDSSRRNKQFRQALTALVDPVDPRSYNYGLLDLAHLVCLKKQSPLCNQCPLISMCHFGQSIGQHN